MCLSTAICKIYLKNENRQDKLKTSKMLSVKENSTKLTKNDQNNERIKFIEARKNVTSPIKSLIHILKRGL